MVLFQGLHLREEAIERQEGNEMDFSPFRPVMRIFRIVFPFGVRIFFVELWRFWLH